MPTRVRNGAALVGTVFALALGLTALAQPAESGASPSVRSDASGPTLPLNDLEAMLALSPSELAREKTPVRLTTPALSAVPAAHCDSASHPLAGVQGRVTQADIDSPQAAAGWTCNTTEVAHLATPGGFRVWRYTDSAGHTCAYYDTSFTAPLNIVSLLGGPSLGVAVVDMSDPAHPSLVTLLSSLAMLSPHESLNLSSARGLLAAEVGNGLTLPGTMDIYDVHADCRHPVLESETPVASGHESGFSPDGKTFYTAGGAGYIYAFDVTNPQHPTQLWQGAYYSHGLNVSADGNVLYQTDPINGNLGLLDVSQIQARRPDPQVSDLSRVTWPTVSIPQNSIPFTSHGHHYLVEFEEFAFRFNPATADDAVGAARILDVDDRAHPTLVSNVRLQVNMKAAHIAADGDPSALPPNQMLGNAMHYCALPTQVNPQLLACSAINSGLRLFNISDPVHPREVAYFVAPPNIDRVPGVLPGDVAMSQPAFDPLHHAIWYTDAVSGLWVVTVSPSAWPR
jgi:hypothetical protein